MVNVKSFLLVVAAVATASAEPEPTVNAAEAEAYWAAVTDPNTSAKEKTSPARRSILARTGDRDMINPYERFCCKDAYNNPPCKVDCNRNHCYRSFLNKNHCPFEAFSFCCSWNSAPDEFKKWAVVDGWTKFLHKHYPFTANCREGEPKETISNIDGVCGCTLTSGVDVEKSRGYHQVRCKKW